METSDVPEMTPIPQGRAPQGALRWFAIVLLIAQLALLVIGIVALWRIGGGWWLGAVAGVVFALLYLAMWYFLLAPGSRRRVAYRERLLVNLVLGPAVVVLGGLSDLWLLALVAVSTIILCDALDERRTV